MLAAAAVALLLLRRGVVATLVAAGAIGAIVALAGGPVAVTKADRERVGKVEDRPSETSSRPARA